MNIITIDFETLPIGQRPDYPPRPVGMAIKWPDRAGKYFAFGHKSGNNATIYEARGELHRAYETGLPILFHNAKFDLDVMDIGLDYPFWKYRPWSDIHDTTYLLFLLDPHARSHGLKKAALGHLGWAADERDAVADWVLENKKAIDADSGRKVLRSRDTDTASNSMEFMEYVPGDLAGRYAVGDVERTAALFAKLYPEVQRLGMGAAYDRERRLLPIWRRNEAAGMRVDMSALERDIEAYGRMLAWADGAIRDYLGVPGLNIDADQQFARAIIAAGLVDERELARTEKTGAFRVGKDHLTPSMYRDPMFASVMGYRNRLTTCLNTFMVPWWDQASRNKGRITTNWNSTRGADGGTRTGRPSTSEHNFLNLAKNFEGRSDGYTHPDIAGVPPLPLVRRYVLPNEGHEWLHRDFNGQELRIFAHYEYGELNAAYNADPRIDVHGWIKDTILQHSGVELERTRVKNVTFARLYGGGVSAIETQARCSTRAEAEAIAAYHDAALPGRRKLVDALTANARMGNPIMTWGGRLYWPEEPREMGGRMQTFEYKLINYLVQGSAADYTKQCLIEWDDAKADDTDFMVTVYDEINISSPIDKADNAMRHLQAVMEAPRLTVPMVSDGKRGVSWGDQVKCT